MTDYNKAREMWAGLSHEERRKILAALKADETMKDHDFAALPPQVIAGVAAGMAVEPASEAITEPAEEEHSSRGRRR